LKFNILGSSVSIFVVIFIHIIAKFPQGKMKVSIITATYNSASTIKDTYLSVQHQTYGNMEHIIIDGASTDNTLQVLDYLGHSGPVVSEKDKGIYDAMNKGLSLASGDIIGILNSDDFYPHAGVIEKVVKAFANNDCDAVYGDLVYVDANHSNKVLRKWIAGGYNKKSFYNGWMPPHPTFFVKREVYEKYGHFNLELKSSSDYELLLRFMFLNDIKVKYLPGVLVHMRAGGHSNRSLRNRLAAHKEDYLAWKSNGISPKWYTLAMKPLRKVKQYVVPKKNNYINQTFFKNLFPAQNPSSQQPVNQM
jgi:glycosyltransferase